MILKTICICILLTFILICVSYYLKISERFTTTRNCFIIISKKVTKNMYSKYHKVITDNLYFISDENPDINKDNIIHYDSTLMTQKGYTNMHSTIKVTSWDKVFYFIENSNIKTKYDYCWIIEDDCFLNNKLFNTFINNYTNDTNDLLLFGWYKQYKRNNWEHWHKNNTGPNTFFKQNNLRASINQICRVSPKLVNEVLNLRRIHNTFCFHELMFASIVEERKLTKRVVKLPEIQISAFNTNLSNKNPEELTKLKYIVVHPSKKWYDN
jgi:hypothetical protein